VAVTSEIGDGIGRVIHAGRALGLAREVAAKAADSSVAREMISVRRYLEAWPVRIKEHLCIPGEEYIGPMRPMMA